jgi:ribonuclease BN (tRNA processing enzyme)
LLGTPALPLLASIHSSASETAWHAFGHSTAAVAGTAARKAGAKCLVLTHIRANRFADPVALAKEAQAAFGRPVGVARDLDAFDF